ncbi:MAG: CoB--CoM heterodisulfide reductase iron-sulfur subunit A family protein, partial [Deltaproteobacteria bacterium]|nr:CoB--CoM heterodisulfide reductase iron-sulfur subunit A family protein [Deltaproteobacteria bacterium]
ENPERDVTVFYRDMRTYGYKEDYYRAAADKGVRFVRFEPQDGLQVEEAVEEGRKVIRVTAVDKVLGAKIAIDADLLALAAAVVPAESAADVARFFKVALSPDGFFLEAHVKLRPVDFAADGVFLCGIGHYPKHVSEAISQAYGAAGRIINVLAKDTVTASGSVCDVNEDECVACGACITACSYGAIEFRDTPAGKKASVNPVLCKGDGLCNSKCPSGAIYLKHYTDREILSQIDAA